MCSCCENLFNLETVGLHDDAGRGYPITFQHRSRLMASNHSHLLSICAINKQVDQETFHILYQNLCSSLAGAGIVWL